MFDWFFGKDEQFASIKQARSGLLIVIFGFSTFMLWALFVPISEGVVAYGSLVVEGNRKSVQHLEGGIVKSIHVKEGDIVEEGQVLLVLDDTQSNAQYEMLFSRYYTGLAMYNRLQAERLGGSEINFSQEIKDLMHMVSMQDITTIQNNLFKARKSQLAGQVEILKQKIEQLKKQLSGMEYQETAINSEIGYIEDELKRLKRLQESDLVDLPRVIEQQKALAQAQGRKGQVESEMAGTAVTIGEARLQILQIEKDNLQEIETSVVEIQERILETREQLIAIRDVINRTKMTAPQSGKVLNLNVFTIGGVVPPGNPLMEIIPSNDAMVIDARLKVTDVDNVLMGMSARIRLSALNQRRTPELFGKVQTVSGDVVVDEATGEQFYLARIIISKEEFERVADKTLTPGMPVEVLIQSGQRTAMEYFTDPIIDILRRSLKEA